MAKTKTRKKTPSKARKRKPKQGYLPGMAPPSIPQIDRLADNYVDVRDRRMELTKEETDAADKLEIAMKQHGLERYEFDSKVVTINKTEKVKVAKKTAAQLVHERVEGTNGDAE